MQRIFFVVLLVVIAEIVLAQPKLLYTKKECLQLYAIDSCYGNKNYDCAAVLLQKLIHSNSVLREDRVLMYKLSDCYVKTGQKDSALKYLANSLNYGLHALHPYGDSTIESMLVFDAVANEKIKQQWRYNNLQNHINDNLVRKIHKLVSYDQVAGDNAVYFDSVDRGIIDSLQRNFAKVRMYNLGEIKQLIHLWGWPGYKILGDEGDNDLWVLVQHADEDVVFQEYVLQLMEAAVLSNNTDKKRYAYLYDRVCVNRGYRQLFGTQALSADASNVVFQPLQDSIHVDRYRRAFGLPTLEAYKNQFKEHVKQKEKKTHSRR
jgi:hypothetical protein